MQVLDRGADRLRARVWLRFGTTAETWLVCSGSEVVAHCSCRPDRVGRICRHLWSSVVAAGPEGALDELVDLGLAGLAGLSWRLLDRPPEGDWDEPLPEPPPFSVSPPAADAEVTVRETQPYVQLLAARQSQGVELLAGVRYGGRRVSLVLAGNPVLDDAGWFWRDGARERDAAQRLRDLGVELPRWLARHAAGKGRWLADTAAPVEVAAEPEPPVAQIAAGKAERLVEQLLEDGWLVEGEAGRYRRGSSLRLSIEHRDGAFWLTGEGRFGEVGLDAARLLAAIRQKRKFIQLGDGDIGVLPAEWLSRWGLLADVVPPTSATQDGVPLSKVRARCVAAILEPEPADQRSDIAASLSLIDEVEPTEAEPGSVFDGSLRPYQRQGVGWLRRLAELGLGGALCDEMGLGKTVQILAHLADRCSPQAQALIVVPTSLLANWGCEATRFVPGLRVLEHWGSGRAQCAEDLRDAAIVLTSYGTLLRDVELLAAVHFDVVVLDEAQAIKNPRSRTARATRRLRARQRIALTGTPLENHLADLWSLGEFLNPGMIPWPAFRRLLRPDSGGARILACLLRPLLLRRIKAQVAPELPARIEHRLLLTLHPEHQRAYRELSEHYRHQLEQVPERRRGAVLLEGLLRLRQLACHPGLLDPKRAREGSAKLDLLLDRLLALGETERKALVFSQFTALLGLVRDRLSDAGVDVAYLDGSTRDRAEQVRRFQQDPACRIFLVSLKAGGTGLNLTAADDVFILDPWWNPAAEAQAIDRAHRIGRTRPVIAWKLVVRDTVEERVVALQDRKRAMADDLFDPELRGLSREELQALI